MGYIKFQICTAHQSLMDISTGLCPRHTGTTQNTAQPAKVAPHVASGNGRQGVQGNGNQLVSLCYGQSGCCGIEWHGHRYFYNLFSWAFALIDLGSNYSYMSPHLSSCLERLLSRLQWGSLLLWMRLWGLSTDQRHRGWLDCVAYGGPQCYYV